MNWIKKLLGIKEKKSFGQIIGDHPDSYKGMANETNFKSRKKLQEGDEDYRRRQRMSDSMYFGTIYNPIHSSGISDSPPPPSNHSLDSFGGGHFGGAGAGGSWDNNSSSSHSGHSHSDSSSHSSYDSGSSSSDCGSSDSGGSSSSD